VCRLHALCENFLATLEYVSLRTDALCGFILFQLTAHIWINFIFEISRMEHNIVIAEGMLFCAFHFILLTAKISGRRTMNQ